ncbi:hypothetical protein TKK_0004447 [Trichogramma kaykai]|uniref:J domain-containing protein n=1 Tax=Trichogramma kaykai TaxID=54128 RepID=A0ABD2XLG3_9HYME
MAVDDPTATVIDLSSTVDNTTIIGPGIKSNPSPTMAGSTTSLPAQVDQAAASAPAAATSAAADLDNTCKPTEPKMLKPEHPLQNSEYTFEPIDSHAYKFRLAEIKKEEANRLYSAKQYKQALVVYNEVIEMCPDVARYYSNRCACFMMMSQYRDALKDAKRCLELDPNFTKAYNRLIKCSLLTGDATEAETAIAKLEKIQPNSSSSIAEELQNLAKLKRYLTEADTAYTSKDYRKVVYCMDRCAEVSPFCSTFKVKKAESLMYLERYSEAEMAANDVLHTDKQNVDAIYIRGTCLYYQDNIDSALKHFQQVFRLAPDHKKALETYKKLKTIKKLKNDGNYVFRSEGYLDAYKIYEQALLVDPANKKVNAKLYFNKATAAAKMQDYRDAIVQCTEALKLDDKYLKALLRRAFSYMILQEYEEAVRDYERALKLDKSRENKRLLMDAQKALKKSKRKDYYKILGIEKNASTEDIKKAYRKRAMVHHPDRHSNASDAEKKEQEKKFKEVGEAYGILSDPKKRSRYDNGHDLEDNDFNFQDMDMESRFQSFFENPFANDCGRGGFRFEYL